MSTPNEKAIAKAAYALEHAAREHYRSWLGLPESVDDKTYNRILRKLRSAAIRYTREIDKGRK